MNQSTKTEKTFDEAMLALGFEDKAEQAERAERERVEAPDTITTSCGEPILCGVCAAACDPDIESHAVVRARLHGGQVEDFCTFCASQGPSDVWVGVEVIDGEIPAGSPWAEQSAKDDDCPGCASSDWSHLTADDEPAMCDACSDHWVSL